MYKIPDQIVQFIEKSMETWRVELTAGGKSLAKVKIQRGVFQGDEWSPFLFVIALMLLNHVLKKCTAGHKLSKLQEKINQAGNVHGRHQTVCQKRKRIGNLLWPREGSLMKTQTQILDNRLYYTRKIELHRKGKKSRTVRITPIVICPSGSEISVLITVKRVHYSKMDKVPTTKP